MFNLDINLKDSDSDIFSLIKQERTRQEEHIELIASENYVSEAVMEAQGSAFVCNIAESAKIDF